MFDFPMFNSYDWMDVRTIGTNASNFGQNASPCFRRDNSGSPHKDCEDQTVNNDQEVTKHEEDDVNLKNNSKGVEVPKTKKT